MVSRERFEAPAFGPFHHLQSVFQPNIAGLDNVALAFQPFLKGLVRCQLEAAGFASQRAQAYLEIPSRLALVRTPQDLFNEQTRFWQTAFQQYNDSTRRMQAAVVSMATPPTFGAGETSKGRKRDVLTMPGDVEPAAEKQPPVSGFPRRVA